MSKVRVLSDILDANNDLDITRLKSSGVTAGSYGSAANVPVITIDAYGRITAAANTAVAGVSGVAYDTATGIYTISTSAGTSYPKDLGIGTADSPSFAGLTVTNTITGNIATSDKWKTARTLALTGAVTGSQSIDGSGNVSITTTATADPTLTLTGDATGNATFTNLGNASLAVTVVNDSHSHSHANLTGTVVKEHLDWTADQGANNIHDNNYTKYVHPTTAGDKHIPTGGAINNYLKYDASGTAVWATIAQGVFPFYKADGSSDPIDLTTDQALPFYKSDGSADNIAFTI